MGCLLSCLACNAATCLCSGICSCMGKAAPQLGRILYTIVFFLVALFSWILRGWADQVLHWVPVLKVCKSEQCFGVLAIYRLCFTLAIFHFIHAILFIGVKKKGDPRYPIQDSYWLFKLGILVGGIILSFVIPNGFYEIAGWVALVASGLFILVQLLLLVDFAHSWAENWIHKYQETEHETSLWWWMLMISSIIMYMIVIILTILMYIFFCKDASKCQLNAGVITINLLLIIVISLLSIHPKVQESNTRSGLLQSSIISIYSTYLIWSAMMSEPYSFGCNPFAKSLSSSGSESSSAPITLSLVIGAGFTVIAVCYTTWKTAHSINTGDNNDLEQSPLLNDAKDDKKENDDNNDKKDNDDHIDKDEDVPYNLTLFHIVFGLGALYISMLMSDWFTIDKGNESNIQVDSGMVAVWVKLISSWISIILYIWTLIAPVLFPDREWGYN